MPRSDITTGYLALAGDTTVFPRVIDYLAGVAVGGTALVSAMLPPTATAGERTRLRRVSPLTLTLNGGFGRVSVAITNADLTETANIAASVTTWIGKTATLYKWITIDEGLITEQFENVALLVGIVTGYRLDETGLEIDLVTRANRASTLSNRRVGSKCPWTFKGTECGYVGVETVCNKLYSDTGGCSGRSNQHRFGGFPDRAGVETIGRISGLGAAPAYQLVQLDTTYTEQRTTLRFDDTFTVTDDPTTNATVITAVGGGGGDVTPDWIDVKEDHDAAGVVTTTTGDITSGTASLTVASATSFAQGQGIRIAGAGVSGADLVTTISTIAGTTFTLDDNASTTVDDAVVSHDDTAAIQAAIDAAATNGKPVYVPAGTYLVSNLAGTNPYFRILGDGQGKSILQSNDSTQSVLEIDNTGATVGWCMIEHLSIKGAATGANNHGIFVHGSDVGGLTINQVRVEDAGGNGIYLANAFNVQVSDVDAYASGHAFDIQGNNTSVLTRCYAHTVGTSKAGYRIRSGQATLIACNGIDSGTTADWGVFGQSVGDDGVETYVNATLMGCNVEDFTNRGVYCKTGSSASLYGTYFVAPASGSVIAYKTDYADGNVPIMDANCRITSKGASWANGSPVHCNANTMPFHRFSRQIYNSSGTEITQYWDGSALKDMPVWYYSSQTGGFAEYINRLRADFLQVGDVALPANYQAFLKSTTTANVTLGLRQINSQTARPLQIENSSGTPLFGIDTDGAIASASAGSDAMTVKTTSGTQIFRAVRATAWGDSANTGFVQLGAVSDHGIISGANGAIIGRLGMTSDSVQVTDYDFTTNGTAGANLEVLSKTTNKVKLDIRLANGTHTANAVQVRDGSRSYFQVDPTGKTTIGAGSNTTGAVVLLNSTNNNTLTIQPGATSANTTLTLPTDDGTAGQFMKTDGAGVLSWDTPAAGANTALSNLASVAVNTSLLPGADNTHDLGSASYSWRDAYIERDALLGRQIQSSGSALSASAGTGAGTSPTITIDGNAIAGTIILTTGTSPATSAQIVQMTMAANFTTYPVVIITPANAAAAALTGNKQVFVDDSAMLANKWTLKSGSTALDATTDYVWYFHVMGI